MRFKRWIIEEGYRTGAKLGLYPTIEDAIGQFPPLYAAARAADFITYFDMMYGKNGLKTKNGLVWYGKEDVRIKNDKKW